MQGNSGVLKNQKFANQISAVPHHPLLRPILFGLLTPPPLRWKGVSKHGRAVKGGDGVLGVRRVMKLILIETSEKKGSKELKLEGG